MTIDEAIANYQGISNYLQRYHVPDEEVQLQITNAKCIEWFTEVAEWLRELKDLREENKVLTRDGLRLIKSNDKLRKKLKQIAKYKRLLKMAVEDLNATVADVYNGGVICECCKWESQIGECCCPGYGGCDIDYRWRYADEALKLLNDEK